MKSAYWPCGRRSLSWDIKGGLVQIDGHDERRAQNSAPSEHSESTAATAAGTAGAKHKSL